MTCACAGKCNKCFVTELAANFKQVLLNLNSAKWMQSAVKNPGSFRAYAKAHGGMGSDGKVSIAWAKSLIGDKKISATIRRKANLFLTFMKAH